MKISVVSYLNSRPFIYGLEKNPSPDWEFSLDNPAECARKLFLGEVNVGLVPVATLKAIPGYHIVSPYCIGAKGKVDSVKLYSEVPLIGIRKILLDYQSRTSVALVKILARELWKIEPEWIEASAGYEKEIDGTTAAVVIGDRTFGLNGRYVHEYDLAEEWYKLTRLPFVFAVWASRKEVSIAFEGRFSAALEHGLTHINDVVENSKQHFPETDVRKYLTELITYRMTPELRKGMELFLDKL